MRRTMLTGLLLAAAAFFTVVMGALLDLDLDSTALLGVSAGAVVALVPDAGVVSRLIGFAAGVVLTLVGYLVRAALLPDTDGGRAVFAALAVALCVAVAAVSLGRLALWATLLGAATFAGAFEAIYDLAPPRVVQNSLDTLTALTLCVAVGFCVTVLAAPQRDRDVAQPEGSTDEVLEDSK